MVVTVSMLGTICLRLSHMSRWEDAFTVIWSVWFSAKVTCSRDGPEMQEKDHEIEAQNRQIEAKNHEHDEKYRELDEINSELEHLGDLLRQRYRRLIDCSFSDCVANSFDFPLSLLYI